MSKLTVLAQALRAEGVPVNAIAVNQVMSRQRVVQSRQH